MIRSREMNRMKTFTALAITVALAAIVPAGVASAQSATQSVSQSRMQATDGQPTAEQTQPERQYNLSRAERAAMQPAIIAVNAGDWAAAEAALPAADAAARGADARYAIAQIRLRIGIETNNVAIQTRAIDDLIASGGATAEEMPGLLENQASLAQAAGDTAKVERALNRLMEINPNDPNAVVRVARVRGANDAPGAIALYQRAIEMQQRAGQPVPTEWRQQIVQIAYQERMPQTVPYLREWLTAAPSPSLWHDSLVIYRQVSNATPALQLDIYRLMRAAQALTSEQAIMEYAEAANAVRSHGEVQAALQDGLNRNLITVNTDYARGRLATASGRVAEDRASLPEQRREAMAARDGTHALAVADAYFSYGEYGPAAELYRAALEKGGQDANLVNSRLGAALALAGRRAEAETVFRSITGDRAELAQFWLLWLSQRGS